ncbi:MAG: PBECR2 nuclease fold domain-containing protein [Candidatus Methanospirare jalkutatii]|nr:PBECR2 nuclease fold domain-containing protein [Candidatus Methanospirare jalkutatii]
MKWFRDIHNRQIRLTDERREHIEVDHPEMSGQIDRIRETLLNPDVIVRPRTDSEVELFYRYYDTIPVTEKYLCVVVKVLTDDIFIITAYFTDKIKRGETLWKRK